MTNYDNSVPQPENRKTRRARKKFYGIIGGAALAAAVAFGGSSFVTSAYAQSATPSAAATPSTGTSTAPAAGTQNQFQGERGFGKQGGRMDRAAAGASGTISAIDGNTLTLKQGNVIVIQATVNSSTVYTAAGKTITLNDLKAGQKVSVRTTTASDGTLSISAVEVLFDHAGGTISAVDSGSLTITKSDNTTVKVALSSATTYSDLGKTINLSDLKAGVKVDVAGTLNSDGTLSAAVVNVQHDRLGGTITAINGNTITVQVDGRGGMRGDKGQLPGANGPANNGTTTPSSGSSTSTTAATRTITVSDSTAYLEGGQGIQLSALAVGDRIDAAGTLSSDGNSLSALQVTVDLPHYQGQVSSVDGSTIVIQDRSGTRTIEVNSSTKYLNGTASAALSDVKAGANISVEGKVDSSGKMTASVVQLGQPQGGPGGMGGKGGRGGH